MKLTEVGPFQHSKKMQQRMADSDYVNRNQRKDCCARCVHMQMRGANPWCVEHRIYVEKMGICPKLTNQQSAELYNWSHAK